MITQFEKLNSQEQSSLLKAPALLSVLASCSEYSINKTQKSDAIKLAHIKTFTAIPELQPYYKEVEMNFKESFEKIAEQYYPYSEEKLRLLKLEINNIQKIIDKLNVSFGLALSASLERYKIHVKRASYSVFQDLIFPITMMDLRNSQSSML